MTDDHPIRDEVAVAASALAIPAALEEHTLPLFDELDSIAAVDAFFHQALAKHIRGQDWDELPIYALAAARLAGRANLDAWITKYEVRCGRSKELAKVWPTLLRAIR